VVSSLPGTEETGAMGGGIRSRQGVCREVAYLINEKNEPIKRNCELSVSKLLYQNIFKHLFFSNTQNENAF
jgi:hypothetical protein